MDTWLDLHMHSVYSGDGEFSPKDLMDKCKQAGLKAVALADHNSIRGSFAAKRAALELGLAYFPAIEIDCMHEGCNLHLLGFGIDMDAPVFKEIEQNVYSQEINRTEKVLHLIRQIGFKFEEEKVRAKARNGIIVAESIAEEVLLDVRNKENELLLPFRSGGSRSDNPFVNFFWDFCAQGKAAYVPIYYVSLAVAVYAIQKNGGVAVLAHPGANIDKDYEFVKSIIKTGIDGMEVYSNYHDAETTKFYAEFSAAHDLLATAGSDFHGKTKPAIHLGELGHPEAYTLYEKLVQRIRQRGGEVVGCLPL